MTQVTIIGILGLVAIPLIAYGILRTQLFDIDLRIRWTIKQSTVAGIFVATMFVISEGASQFLSAELGNVVGLLAAGVLIFPELADWTRKCRDPERPTLTPYMLWTDVRNITCAHLTHNHGELSV